MKRFLHLLLLAFLLPLSVAAQTDSVAVVQADTAAVPISLCTISGRVVDEEQKPLPFVTVKVQGQIAGGVTNLDGRYSFDFHSEDSVAIIYSLIGYERKTKVLMRPQGKLTWNLTLRSSGTDMGEVVVKETRRQMGSTQELTTEDLRRLPSTSGNAVEDLVATQAGVSTHNELSSQYNVRGGSFDENCVYVNGVEVYRPLLISSGQQEGLSVINSDMVERIQFSAGGFEAKYGDRMSSVLDITYKKPVRHEGSFSASLLGASLYDGMRAGKVSLSQGLRYKTNRYLLGSLETTGEYDPSFLDYQAYLSWSPSKNWTFDAIGYISRNNYRFKPKDRETNFGTMEDVKSFRVYFDGVEEDLFRTLFGAISVTRRFGQRSMLTLGASAFSTKERETYDIQGQYWLDDTNTSEQLGVGTYMEHARNLLTSSTQTLRAIYEFRPSEHHLQAGILWKHESIKENSREWEFRDSAGYSMPHYGDRLELIYNLKSVQETSSNRLEFFAQDTWRRETGLGIFSLNYGVRLSHWSWNGETLLSPRVSVGFVPAKNDRLTFRLATGMYYQAPFYKELRDTMTIDGATVVQLNKDIQSQQSFQVVLGGEYRFHVAGRPFKFTAEAYYKAQNRLNPYNVDNLKVVYYGRNEGNGYVVGADFKVYGEFVPGTDSWISFSLMKAQMELHGKHIPQPTDQRWNINFFFSDYFPGTDRWKMTLKMAFADGLPFGTPHSGLERHVFRAPPYRRVDLGMSYRLLDNEDHHRHGFGRNLRNVWLGLDCFNLLGISNVASYLWITDIRRQQYAVPNYLTGRQLNARFLIEF
ncbi:MAG: TonB-dependent receptor [Bacteroidaceae bacterium]|nr:TonB-dependent receptor [Bacteroidaceae bacterium]